MMAKTHPIVFLVVNRVVFVMNMYAIGWMELNGRGNEITEWIGLAFELNWRLYRL